MKINAKIEWWSILICSIAIAFFGLHNGETLMLILIALMINRRQ